MENLKVYDKKDNAVIRKLKKALAIATLSIATLTACVSNKNNTTQKEPTGIETITPTDTIDPTEIVTTTPTVTPTPALQPKTLQQVKDDLKNIKVSVDELMNEDVVYPTVFGAPDESFTKEALKRTSYFESFGIMDFKTAQTLVADLNYCYLNSDAVDTENAKNYLSLIDKNEPAQLIRILQAIMDHNIKNPDNQIVISWGIIDQNDKVGRAVINNRQQQMTKVLIKKQTFDSISISDKTYNVTVICNDGSTIKLNGPYDDLNIAFKVMDTGISCASVVYTIDRPNEYPSNNAYSRLGKPFTAIYPAFSDPEHANVRRHGFDATDYYEEDLNKTASYK